MTDIEISSEITVKLIRALASDDGVVQAAQVSVKGENNPETDSPRLINYLMSSRHGCYSADTEVLTGRGWVAWPNVVEGDTFYTKNLETDEIELQEGERVVAYDYNGSLIRFKNKHLDLLVTPNHNMVESHRTDSTGSYSPYYLTRADTMIDRAYRIPKSGGVWVGEKSEYSLAELALIGFFIGDGSGVSTPSFNIRKAREISFLEETVSAIPGASISLLASGARSVTGLSSAFRELQKDAYTATKEKQIPSYLLKSTPNELSAILDGLMASDGSTNAHRKNYYTTSSTLRDGLQELVLKMNNASDYSTNTYIAGKFAGTRSKPVFVVGIFSGRNSQPRLGRTKADRVREISSQEYSGKVYCTTVKNGTLFVRRNGKTALSGNSPFEHNSFTFFVEAPIFVFREWHRHRIASINEMSGRYSKLLPKFYTPSDDRKLVNTGTSARPEFDTGTEAQMALVHTGDFMVAQTAWNEYELRLEAGIANEIARTVLPVSIYSQMYWTANLRSILNFLALRIDSPDSSVRSRPQAEIQMAAEKMEEIVNEYMPITMEAWRRNGRSHV